SARADRVRDPPAGARTALRRRCAQDRVGGGADGPRGLHAADAGAVRVPPSRQAGATRRWPLRRYGCHPAHGRRAARGGRADILRAVPAHRRGRGVTLIVLTVAIAAALYLWYGYRLRRLADARLADMVGPAIVEEAGAAEPARRVNTFPTRYRWIPPAVGLAAMLALWIVVHLPIAVAAAAGLLIGVIIHLLEERRGDQQEALIEA